jgi:hypothetical protein
MRELVIKNMLVMFPTLTFVADLHVLLNRIRPGAVLHVAANASPIHAVNVIVDLAMTENWIRALLAEIPRNNSNKGELDIIAAELDSQPAPTSIDPFNEVLLEGNRPFVNRVDLRANLKQLCAPSGSSLLLVRGQPQTGKTFSFYLAQHIARQTGYITSQFEVKKTPDPDQLAAEVLDRIGANVELRKKGLESAERWAEKLAGQVKDAIEERELKRVFVFDDFPVDPQPPLPQETFSFIVRLAKYSDEEIQKYLRVVLIQFTATLPPALDDAAETDEAVPFTSADMLSVLKQVREARGWRVSDSALQVEIQAIPNSATLRDRFKFLRKTIRTLGAAGQSVQPPPAGPGG